MATMDSSFIAFMEQQRAEYRQSLPGRLERIDLLWRAEMAGAAEPDALAALERLAHGIAGSAATFGFVPLGSAAKVLELALNPFVESAQPLTPVARSEVAAAVDELLRCWAEA